MAPTCKQYTDHFTIADAEQGAEWTPD